MTVYTAVRRQYEDHRLWANTLVLSAKLFVVGRCAIAAMAGWLGCDSGTTYWCAIGVATTTGELFF
eukprot:SAG31_NODE_3175_length_4586_cov_4.176064_8_plen_66_part_00